MDNKDRKFGANEKYYAIWIEDKKKQDDVSDCLLMIITYCYLKYISNCIQSILSQNFSKKKMKLKIMFHLKLKKIEKSPEIK